MGETARPVVYTPPFIVRVLTTLGLLAAVGAFAWAGALIIGGFLGKTVPFHTVTVGFAILLGACIVLVGLSALVEDAYNHHNKFPQARTPEHEAT